MTLLRKDFSEISSIGQSNAGLTILDLDADGQTRTNLLDCARHLTSIDSFVSMTPE